MPMTLERVVGQASSGTERPFAAEAIHHLDVVQQRVFLEVCRLDVLPQVKPASVTPYRHPVSTRLRRLPSTHCRILRCKIHLLIVFTCIILTPDAVTRSRTLLPSRSSAGQWRSAMIKLKRNYESTVTIAGARASIATHVKRQQALGLAVRLGYQPHSLPRT